MARAFRWAGLCVAVAGLLAAAPDSVPGDSPAAQAESEARASMELGRSHLQAGAYAEARAAYARVIPMKALPAYFKSLSQLRIAQSFLFEQNTAGACDAYRKVHAILEAPPHHVWEADEAVKAIERVQAGLPPRDPCATRTAPPSLPEPGLTLYVAQDGADSNPGTLDEPFATVQRALDALPAQAGWPDGGVKVCVRQGVYRLHEGLKVPSGISAREGAPLVIAAHKGESVRLSGGAPVTDFRLVNDPAVLERLPEESRGQVWVTDLKAQGITAFPPLVHRGFACAGGSSLELYFDGKPMTPARWPNEGFVRTRTVAEPGSAAENRGAVFEYEGDRPARWLQARDIWLYGYWYYDWADNAIAVAGIDPAAHQIRTVHTSAYGMRENQPYYAFNLLEEIDVPGEWYLDRESALLYFLPPADPSAATIEVSTVAEPLLEMEDVSNAFIQGLTFELGAGDGIVIRGGGHCLVAGSTVRRLAGTGVICSGGHDHGVLSCDIYTLGRRGTEITGGDRKTLSPARHFVENCDIYDFSRIDRTYTPAVQIEGVGNRIAHNHFHDTPCHAIRLEGNDHVVEFNDIHDVVRESDDQGGIDMFRNPSYRGNVLRYNFWHDIGSGRACGQAGIRLDDAISGTVVYGNVFYHCSEAQFGGVQIHGGKDNWVDNNLFIDCRYGISFSPWGKERWKQFLASDSVVALLRRDVDITQPPYSTRYPGLAHIEEGNDINLIWRNLVYNCGDFLARDRGMQILIDNEVTQDDPGFVDPAKQDFTLREDSPVRAAIGFEPIPPGEIGLYDDPFRAGLKKRER